jgi:L-ribulokinase
MAKYSLGLDFGTESARALLVDVSTGEEIVSSVYEYKDGVIDEVLPESQIKLGHDWALQNPEDYLNTLKEAVPDVIKASGIKSEDIIGIGIDFTACTIMPIDEKGIPLCMLKKYKDQPHAWVKLWKHHAAQPEADKISELAQKDMPELLERYGGKMSSEWLLPKVWQILDEAPEIYEAAHKFIEAGDWIVFKLTGQEKRNACAAGYKGMWDKEKGFPPSSFLEKLDPRLKNLTKEKLSSDIYPADTKTGELTEDMAKITGLKEGTAVSAANIDAHAAVPAATITEEGKMLMVMGTSICHMLLGKEKKMIKGIAGVVEDGIISGYFGYEAGQCSGGDILTWFVNNCVPENYYIEAKRDSKTVYKVLDEKAAKLKPGAAGLLALDWLNGNRSVLVDADLTGLILGCTINTKPEEIFRALMEATAFGTEKIIRAFEEHNVSIKELYACGGLAEKNELLMQIFADVTGRELKIAASAQTCALGSAMFGAVVAGKKAGGYDTIQEAAKNMAHLKKQIYKPIKENQAIYKKLFAEYDKLHDYFGRDINPVMKTLKAIKIAQS